MNHARFGVRILSLLAISVAAVACLDGETPSKEWAKHGSDPAALKNGQAHFVFNGLGNLTISGLAHNNLIPVKVYGTALLLVDQQETGRALDGRRLPEVMRKYGFMTPGKIENWNHSKSAEPRIDDVLGLVRADIKATIFGRRYALETAGFTCAACHSGMTYDADGRATGRAWLGGSNSSLNLDGYFNDIYRGLDLGMREDFLQKIKTAFPDIGAEESRTIGRALLPIVRRELKKLSRMKRSLPFPNGGPGLTNGVGAFKRNAGLIRDKYSYDPGEASFVSIPDISDRSFRSSFLADGVYAPKGFPRFAPVGEAEARDPRRQKSLAEVVSFFAYPAMSVPLANIEPHMPDVRKIFGFVAELKPAPYPGEIDRELAARGESVYRNRCASCHGSYSALSGADRPRLVAFPNVFVPQNRMGTDPVRWARFTPQMKKFADGREFAKYVAAGHSMGGYVAPILTGVWATAPYLHNGSVPTLWHLMRPESRPTRFQHGGHDLDLKKVGIRLVENGRGELVYPVDVTPWSKPAIFDTRETGRSNKGHENEFRVLTEDEKTALLEYLKLL